MHADLEVVVFKPEIFESKCIQSFDCGDNEWELEVSNWLKTKDGALLDMEVAGNELYLYFQNEEMVGIGAIGQNTASWPKNSSPRRPSHCISWLGVSSNHKRKGIGQTILDDLQTKIIQRCTDTPILVTMCVHVDNTTALSWYTNEKNGFKKASDKLLELNGKQYVRLIKNLSV